MLEEGLLRILDKVCEVTGIDFRQYKESSLRRRMERRLTATKVFSYEEYAEVLDREPDEYRGLAIKVTEFFRDRDAWGIIGEKILPEIIKRKGKNRERAGDFKPALRIWSAGCATGQEAYSIAIVLDRLLGERRGEVKVDIWGTDIIKETLLKAEQAVYKSTAVKGVPQDILNEYFDIDNGFRVSSLARESVHFKFQDLVLDEPFKEMDLILCRNVAIYFERPLQEKIFTDFYNGLNRKGYLFLGKAETLIGSAREKFKVIDKRWKIYRKEDNNAS